VIQVNGHDQAFCGETVNELLARLEIDARGVAVAIDGEIVRRSDWPTTLVSDRSRVEVVTAAAGG